MLGIDAGGSKTVALLASLDGVVVAEGRAGGANLRTHGELVVEKRLHEVIDQVLDDHAARPVAVCVGMSCGGPVDANFANPKSRIFTRSSVVMKTFSGFRSRWTMPFSCAACRP